MFPPESTQPPADQPQGMPVSPIPQIHSDPNLQASQSKQSLFMGIAGGVLGTLIIVGVGFVIFNMFPKKEKQTVMVPPADVIITTAISPTFPPSVTLDPTATQPSSYTGKYYDLALPPNWTLQDDSNPAFVYFYYKSPHQYTNAEKQTERSFIAFKVTPGEKLPPLTGPILPGYEEITVDGVTGLKNMPDTMKREVFDEQGAPFLTLGTEVYAYKNNMNYDFTYMVIEKEETEKQDRLKQFIDIVTSIKFKVPSN